jgi:nickel-dependent lactate racemase
MIIYTILCNNAHSKQKMSCHVRDNNVEFYSIIKFKTEAPDTKTHRSDPV